VISSSLYYCLLLDPDTRRWSLVKYTNSPHEASSFACAEIEDITDTKLVVGPCGADDPKPDYTGDDGFPRFRIFGATNGSRVKQDWPARITPEVMTAIEEGYPKLMAEKLAAYEKRRERAGY